MQWQVAVFRAHGNGRNEPVSPPLVSAAPLLATQPNSIPMELDRSRACSDQICFTANRTDHVLATTAGLSIGRVSTPC